MTTRKSLAFVDLKAQQERIYPRILENIKAVLAHGQYILGPEMRELEERLAAYTGVKHALTCSSGTDALLMILLAKGVGRGDAILTTPFTFIATAEVVGLLGATPVFVDIDPDTYNLDPEALVATLADFEKNPKTRGLTPRGVLAVDLFGQPADYAAINAVADKWGLFVVEDAAQSFGALYHGRRAGSLTAAAATSFFPAKPLGGYGDGGALFTDDDEMAAALLSIRNHGQGGERYEHVRLGLNGRLDTLQAAVLLAKLEIFDQELAARQEVAARYHEGLKDLVKTPAVAAGCTSAWAQYSVESPDRAHLLARLREAEVPTAVYYPIPLHVQKVFQGLGYSPGDFPVSELAAARIFSLPMHPYLAPADQERIIDLIRQALTY